MAEQAPTIESPRRHARPETSAWLMLITFFLIFCAIVASAGLAGWSYYTAAMERVEGGLVRAHVRAGVNFLARGTAKKVTPDVPCPDNPAGITDFCQSLSEGDLVKAVPDAGYGQVASIKLPDQTQVDLWAHPTGADLTLQRYAVSRWSKQRQIVEFKQSAGYARYDIPAKNRSQYADVTYSVIISKTNMVHLGLASGGSYSVNVPHTEPGRPATLTESGDELMVEVAVRSGSVDVQTADGVVTAHPGEKIQVNEAGVASAALPARWELIRNGKLANWSPGAKSDASGTWIQDVNLTDENATEQERNGTFTIEQRCGPVTPDNCTPAEKANIGQFRRQGNQTKSFGVLIGQSLDLDVSEYPTLELRAWVRVDNQSIAKAGTLGTECPMTIRLTFKQKSPSDTEENRHFCIYVDETAADLPRDQKGSEFIYTPVHQGQWYNLKYVLRNYDSLKEAYYLQSIVILANGHDYVSEITDISLLATQQP
ncbi:MAG: hypothetical protein ABIV47_13395 [Roseiflexaceae bacterium]